mmetsp:Transcript_54929/g.134397  ORF Transcript_54929/g.134397 Transcript_54929/m.134397 type:complete len:219 (+) Transcript_54929:253-909(+)
MQVGQRTQGAQRAGRAAAPAGPCMRIGRLDLLIGPVRSRPGPLRRAGWAGTVQRRPAHCASVVFSLVDDAVAAAVQAPGGPGAGVVGRRAAAPGALQSGQVGTGARGQGRCPATGVLQAGRIGGCRAQRDGDVQAADAPVARCGQRDGVRLRWVDRQTGRVHHGIGQGQRLAEVAEAQVGGGDASAGVQGVGDVGGAVPVLCRERQPQRAVGSADAIL